MDICALQLLLQELYSSFLPYFVTSWVSQMTYFIDSMLSRPSTNALLSEYIWYEAGSAAYLHS